MSSYGLDIHHGLGALRWAFGRVQRRGLTPAQARAKGEDRVSARNWLVEARRSEQDDCTIVTSGYDAFCGRLARWMDERDCEVN